MAPTAVRCGGKVYSDSNYNLEALNKTNFTFCRYLIAYKNLLRAIENIGIAVVYGIRYYGTGRITHDNYVQFIRHDALGFEYIDQSKNFVPQVDRLSLIRIIELFF